MSDPERRLRELVRDLGRVLVAYSGGVDSATLLAVCREELGRDGARAAIADSPSLPRDELAAARRLADTLDVDLAVVATAEADDPRWAANGLDRCYHCKAELFRKLEPLAAERGVDVLVYGANASDAVDFRPGARAAARFGVRAPLAEAGLDKGAVRALARRLGLAVWDKPAAPCLASRVPYGTAIDRATLARVEGAEDHLRSVLGLRELRVRHHGAIARLEIRPEDRRTVLAARASIVERLRALGYRRVTLDLAPFLSGSLNPIEVRSAGRPPGDGEVRKTS